MQTTNRDMVKVQSALQEIEKRQETGQVPFTCFYIKEGELIGSYFCGDEQEKDSVLFLNKGYPDPVFLLNLINQHCQYLKEEVKVYTLDILDRRETELYEKVRPKSSIFVNL